MRIQGISFLDKYFEAKIFTVWDKASKSTKNSFGTVFIANNWPSN